MKRLALLLLLVLTLCSSLSLPAQTLKTTQPPRTETQIRTKTVHEVTLIKHRHHRHVWFHVVHRHHRRHRHLVHRKRKHASVTLPLVK